MADFCIYFTAYSGNKLPPFYIGSSSVSKVEAGYKGSVSSKKYAAIWKNELRDNPNLFKTRPIAYYNTRKEALAVERRLQVKLSVVKSDLYINQAVAAPNGFFGMDCKGALSPRYGKKATNEQRKANSFHRKGIALGPNPKKGRSGKKNGMFGRTRTPEEIEKMNATRAARTPKSNLASYARKKTDAERQKIREHQMLNRVCRLSDRKEMNVSNFTRYSK